MWWNPKVTFAKRNEKVKNNTDLLGIHGKIHFGQSQIFFHFLRCQPLQLQNRLKIILAWAPTPALKFWMKSKHMSCTINRTDWWGHRWVCKHENENGTSSSHEKWTCSLSRFYPCCPGLTVAPLRCILVHLERRVHKGGVDLLN